MEKEKRKTANEQQEKQKAEIQAGPKPLVCAVSKLQL